MSTILWKILNLPVKGLHARHGIFLPTDKYINSRGRPCVVMANGFGGTKDTGLLNFAEPLSKAGFDTFIFDYRGFGESGGFQDRMFPIKSA